MIKLLIVDDDYRIRKLVRAYAEMESFDCIEASNGIEALELVRTKEINLILLDIMMTGTDGFFILEKIRSFSTVPIIMLTARYEEYDKLWCFKLGADDYVSKPFSPRELMARIHAVLRRSSGKQSLTLHFGDLCINPDFRSVTIKGEKINLPPKEFELLFKLAQNNHLVMSREKLLDSVWEYNYYGDGRTVDTHIKSLRDHLGAYRNLIKTVWGVGYKFEYNEKNET